MATPAEPLLDELLGPLHMHLLSARAAYRGYLDNGRTFLWANSLKRINGAARALLLAKGYLLPEALQGDVTALVRHWGVWLALWDEHAELTAPGADDPFVFENRVNFPREAEQRLEQLYQQLRGALSSQ